MVIIYSLRDILTLNPLRFKARISKEVGTAELKWKECQTESWKQARWCSLGRARGRSAQDRRRCGADADGRPGEACLSDFKARGRTRGLRRTEQWVRRAEAVGAKFADNGSLGRIVGSFQIHHTLVHKVK